MLKSRVRLERDQLVFDYEGKGGRRRVQAIADPAASSAATRCEAPVRCRVHDVRRGRGLSPSGTSG
jgi:hypothetical protein